MNTSIGMRGRVAACVNRAAKAPLRWRIQNLVRPGYLAGWVENAAAKILSAVTGIPTLTAELRARVVKADGAVVDYGIVSFRKVTQAGVAFLVDDWADNSTDITNMNYHASGTGTTAESNGDTALVSESTAITDRAAGTKTQPSANILQTQATQTYTGSGAITEHGLLSSATEGSGVLWDRSVFAAINVASGDSIAWTYQCTVNYEA